MTPARAHIALASALARLAVGAALLLAAIGWRTPVLAGWRPLALAILIAGPLALLVIEWRLRRCADGRLGAAVRLAAVAAAGLALATTLVIETTFRRDRSVVLDAEPERLERLGRHVMVGYRDLADLRVLIERKGIAGVFVTTRNVEGRKPAEIADTIAALQAIRARQGLPPLWIATDEEGGVVSRLSPPLTRRPPLSSLLAGAAHAPAESEFAQAEGYGAAQGRELAALGINLNFAPVVDLNHRLVNPQDRYTRIYQRAISDDPAVVTEVARRYCAGLARSGVACTLKHFPGLGRVFEDTHVGAAELSADVPELDAADWIPFRKLMEKTSFTMLAHVRVSAIDRERPASLSRAVVAGLLRGSWRYDGILITDDFSMGAIAGSRDGVGRAAVAALTAGVDLLLVSYDCDQYFPLMAALLEADRAGRLASEVLASSDARLSRVSPPRRD